MPDLSRSSASVLSGAPHPSVGGGNPQPLRDAEPMPLAFERLGSVFLLATAVALAVLWSMGMGNDQALFEYYAHRMRDGALLYHDIWDNKQPGIFLWYVASDWAFGHGWQGLRQSLALWYGASAVAAAVLCGLVKPRSRAWWLAPVFTVGLALLRIDAERPAQVEALVDLPLMLLAVLLLIEPRSRSGRSLRWAGVGVLTGVVASLKLVLAPLPAAFIVVALVWRLHRREIGALAVVQAFAWMLAGFALVIGPIVAWFWSQGIIAEFMWTMFVYPGLALKQVPTQKLGMLVGSFKWLAVTCIPVALAAVLAVREAVREPAARASLLGFICVAWIGVGVLMIVLQKFSWWNTHMDLIDWPVGMLAALGLAGALGTDARVRTPLGRSLVLAAALLAVAGMGLHLARFGYGALRGGDWPKPHAEQRALETARLVAGNAVAPCGTVYAIGDQAGVERATGLKQALHTHGLWFGAFLTAQIEQLPAELARVGPDLVYFDADHRRDFLRRAPVTLEALDAWLGRDYDTVAVDALGGHWFHRRGARPGDVCPAVQPFHIPGRLAG